MRLAGWQVEEGPGLLRVTVCCTIPPNFSFMMSSLEINPDHVGEQLGSVLQALPGSEDQLRALLPDDAHRGRPIDLAVNHCFLPQDGDQALGEVLQGWRTSVQDVLTHLPDSHRAHRFVQALQDLQARIERA